MLSCVRMLQESREDDCSARVDAIKNVNIEVSCEKECGRRVLNSQNLFQL